MDAPILKIELQHTAMDCAIAVLAMLLGSAYVEVLMIAAHVAPKVLTDGMSTREIRAIAKRMGFSAKRQRHIDLLNDTGALTVENDKWPADHLVVLREGLIVETDGTLWDTDMFMSAYKARPKHLLVFEKLAEEG